MTRATLVRIVVKFSLSPGYLLCVYNQSKISNHVFFASQKRALRAVLGLRALEGDGLQLCSLVAFSADLNGIMDMT